MIYYVIYTSTPTGAVNQKVVDDITAESIKWNTQHGITGMLLCLEDRYFQFLEGDEEEVVKIFNMIKDDPRHKDVTPRVKGYSNDRVFSEWSMGSWMLANKELEKLSALEDLTAYLKDPLNTTLPSKRYVSMMDNLLQTWLVHEPERAKRLKS